tara:strand:+ start:1656 stop:1859 length:204 start_codon:yes stop_codon:yes gene_type:complete
MGKVRNRGFGISIYFPKEMLKLLDSIEEHLELPATKSSSLSEYVCASIKEKAQREGISGPINEKNEA